ncbi:NADH:flavorubredoxin reductase NorW [Psychromonas ossibalaenae]|uniref:NADH:flavorubredoxin reductase NorW n=1 Tax=Psychromonas ossibalaenae TaxID=444922 RepID=UPI00036D4899|nr:NADH:flavorubredoxin reductase NorW [Psychromonas ossibalaenae]
MIKPIIIIGSGFAAYQLVKTLRRENTQQAITVITACEGDEYSKPDLSHVFSNKQTAADLVRMNALQFATEYNITLLTRHRVDSIDTLNKTLTANNKQFAYDKLVIATGASAFVPPTEGDAADRIITLNSLSEYKSAQEKLTTAESVLVIGAGLIGTEIAMDLNRSGRQVVLVDPAKSLLAALLPDFIAAQLYQSLGNSRVDINLGTQVSRLEQTSDEQSINVTLSNGRTFQVDGVISAAGLKANTRLASEAGITCGRGIIVDSKLQSSARDVYALGDCAEIDGKLLPFLQPILLSANALAKTLLGRPSEIKLPAMLVKVKTPHYPIQLCGNTTQAGARWQIDAAAQGMTAKAFDDKNQLIGFVVTQDNMKQAFPLLRQLPAVL